MRLKEPYGGGFRQLSGYEAWQWFKTRLDDPWWTFCRWVTFTTNAELHNLSTWPNYDGPISPERWEYINRKMSWYYSGWGVAVIAAFLLIVICMVL